MGEYCDKCGKTDEDVKIVSIRWIRINTNKTFTDKRYVDKDPHLCKKCYKTFTEEMEKLINNTFGHI